MSVRTDPLEYRGNPLIHHTDCIRNQVPGQSDLPLC